MDSNVVNNVTTATGGHDMARKRGVNPRENMIHRKKVTLALEAPQAESVSLMGDFNHWNPKAHSMKKEAGGIWKKIIMVQPGRYEYRFLVDGQWQNDPANDQTCPNCFGTKNNVLTVSG
jgi:1,4-alpha-glucan branching enzyme